MLHDFCPLQNIEDFRSQRNSAAEWSRNFLTISKRERSRTGSKRSESSGSVVFRIFELGGNLFSSLCGFLNVKSISLLSYGRSRVFLLAFDLQRAVQNDLQFRFVDMPQTYVSSASGLCKFIFRQKLNHGSLALSTITFCKVVNKTSFNLANNVPLIRLIQAT